MDILNIVKLDEILENVKQAKTKVDEFKIGVELIEEIRNIKRLLIYGLIGNFLFVGGLMLILKLL